MIKFLRQIIAKRPARKPLTARMGSIPATRIYDAYGDFSGVTSQIELSGMAVCTNTAAASLHATIILSDEPFIFTEECVALLDDLVKEIKFDSIHPALSQTKNWPLFGRIYHSKLAEWGTVSA